jgi:hypothetical protein
MFMIGWLREGVCEDRKNSAARIQMIYYGSKEDLANGCWLASGCISPCRDADGDFRLSGVSRVQRTSGFWATANGTWLAELSNPRFGQEYQRTMKRFNLYKTVNMTPEFRDFGRWNRDRNIIKEQFFSCHFKWMVYQETTSN